jgi:hypothetical protein
MNKVFAASILVATSIITADGGAAEPLGRLFFTPAQRNALDAGKFASTKQAVQRPRPATIHLDGVVTRSDADRTVWINGRAYHDASPQGVQVGTNPATPASASVRITGKSSTTRVKVGQQLDLNSGQIRENFARRPETNERFRAPAESGVSHPIIEKHSKETGEPARPIRESEKPAGKTLDPSGDNGDAPVLAR